MRGRLSLAAVLGILFAALTAWWILYTPYHPERLYAPIPADASFVSEHRDLVARWDSFSKNPLTLSLFSSLGVKPSSLADLTGDPESREWFEKLASEHLVLAYVPRLGRHAEPAWVFSSWIGGRSQRLRWLLSWNRVSGYKRSGLRGGRHYWIVENAFLQSDLTLSISFVEGMIVGCLSAHPDSIWDVLEAYDGAIPSLMRRADFPGTNQWCSGGTNPDRGWVDPTGIRGPLPLEMGSFSYEFTNLTPEALTGRVCGEAPFELPPAGARPLNTAGIERLFGSLPSGLALADAGTVLPLLEDRGNPVWLRLLGEMVREQESRSVVLAMFGDDYSGRFKGIKVPAFVLGIPLTDERAAPAKIGRVIDRLNAQYRWGLVPREIFQGSNKVYAIEGTAVKVYTMLTLDEKPAYAVCNGWLLLSSNLVNLRNLLARHARAESVEEAVQPRWKQALDEEAAPFYLWLDVVRGGKAVRLALSTYSLKLLLEDPRGTARERQRLNEIKAWTEALTPLDSCRLWMSGDGQTVTARFRIGR